MDSESTSVFISYFKLLSISHFLLLHPYMYTAVPGRLDYSHYTASQSPQFMILQSDHLGDSWVPGNLFLEDC